MFHTAAACVSHCHTVTQMSPINGRKLQPKKASNVERGCKGHLHSSAFRIPQLGSRCPAARASQAQRRINDSCIPAYIYIDAAQPLPSQAAACRVSYYGVLLLQPCTHRVRSEATGVHCDSKQKRNWGEYSATTVSQAHPNVL